MKRDWEPEELIDCWTLGGDDWRLVSTKGGATRLGFCLLLKYFELEARFPRHAGEQTLRDVIREARANQRTFQERKRTVLRSSYSSYYRRLLPKLLGRPARHYALVLVQREPLRPL